LVEGLLYHVHLQIKNSSLNQTDFLPQFSRIVYPVGFVGDFSFGQVFSATEGGDVGVRVGPLHWNVEQLAG